MQLNVALIRMVFPDCDAVGGQRDALKRAHSQGHSLRYCRRFRSMLGRRLAKSARMTRWNRPPARVIAP